MTVILHGVDVAEFVALFLRKRKELYLSKGRDARIRPLNEWVGQWIETTWPDKSREERMKCWHELLTYVP